MDEFDRLTTESTNYSLEEKLTPYNEALFKYLQGKKFLILVVIAAAYFIYSIYSIFLTGALTTQTGYTNSLNIGVSLFSLVFSALVPIGLLLLYLGALKNSAQKATKAINLLKLFFKIYKIIIIIVAIMYGFVLLITIFIAPIPALTSGIIVAGIFYVILYFINQFIVFFDSLEKCSLGDIQYVPTGEKVKKIVFILSVFLFIIIIFSLILLNFTVTTVMLNNLQQALIDANPDFNLDIVAMFVYFKRIILIGMFVFVVVVGYINYFFMDYYKYFTKFNYIQATVDQKVEEARIQAEQAGFSE